MSKSHMFSYSNINKSSPLTYLGLDFYFFFVSEKFILFTRAILLLEKLLPYETSEWGIGFPLPWRIFRIFNRSFARWRRFTTTTRILQGFAFLSKLGLSLFKPRRDFQI